MAISTLAFLFPNLNLRYGFEMNPPIILTFGTSQKKPKLEPAVDVYQMYETQGSYHDLNQWLGQKATISPAQAEYNTCQEVDYELSEVPSTL